MKEAGERRKGEGDRINVRRQEAGRMRKTELGGRRKKSVERRKKK